MTIKVNDPSADDLKRFIGDTWANAAELRIKCFLLIESLEEGLTFRGGKRSDGNVTLTISEERIDAIQWLAGEALKRAREIENSFDALLGGGHDRG